jgi:protein-tyrosine phosphatase
MDEVYDGVYISSIDYIRENSVNVDSIITVCQDGVEEDVSCNYSKYSLKDGRHDPDKFKDAVDELLEKIENEEEVLVHCHRGMSRSPSIVITALSIHTGKDVNSVKSMVKDKRPFIMPARELWESVRRYGHTYDEKDS